MFIFAILHKMKICYCQDKHLGKNGTYFKQAYGKCCLRDKVYHQFVWLLLVNSQ